MKTIAALFPFVLAGAATAQTTWFVRGGGAQVHVVARTGQPGQGGASVSGLTPAPFTTAGTDCAVHFGADAAGKPGSLRLTDVQGALVQVAVSPAAPAAVTFVPLDGPDWSDHAFGDAVARLLGDRHDANVRIEATIATVGEATRLGLVARAQPDGGHYRYEWDRLEREHRLVRRMGEHELVIARASADGDGPPQRLALQVDGFRLQACCDDIVVLQALDGGFEDGAAGTWQLGGGAWRTFSLGPPAAPRASVALVRTEGRAELHGWVAATPGSLSVLELRLDRPHALVPANSAGELWLLQPDVAPVVARGDWRMSLGPGAIGEVLADGTVRAALHVPDLPDLRGRACLVRAIVVDAGGEAVQGATPFVPLWWPADPRR